MADSRDRALPLVTVGDASFVIHDWHFMLSRLGLLPHCKMLGGATRGLGHLVMFAGLLFGAWLLVRMFRQRHEKRVAP